MITETEMPPLDGMTFGEKIKFVIDYIVNNALSKGTDAATVEAAAIIKNYIASMISTAMAFAIIFVCVILLQKLIVLLLDLVVKVPGLKQLNGGLGFVFGIFLCGRSGRGLRQICLPRSHFRFFAQNSPKHFRNACKRSRYDIFPENKSRLPCAEFSHMDCG